MMRKVLENIPGIEFYPVLALILFVLFFATLMVWFVRADKSRLAVLADLPLSDNLHHPHSQPSREESEQCLRM